MSGRGDCWFCDAELSDSDDVVDVLFDFGPSGIAHRRCLDNYEPPVDYDAPTSRERELEAYEAKRRLG